MTPRAMSPNSPDASSDRGQLRIALCLAVFLAMISSLVWPAAAQRYVGKNSTPSVTVDYSVLDELGRAPNVPQLILQNPTGSAYRNNPYRGRLKFPVVSKSGDRARTKRPVLTPPTATNRRIGRRPARRARPVTRNSAVRRTPMRKQPQMARKPRASAPPPPSMTKAPATVVPLPPPKIAVPQRRNIAAPTEKSVSARPKTIEPPPLPPATAVSKSKPKKIARGVVLPPPAPPPKVAARSVADTRKVQKNRSSTTSSPPKAKPVRTVRVSRAPKAEPKRIARAKTKQVASLPRSTAAVRSGSLRRIEFPPGSAKLSNKASLGLNDVAAALSNDPALRIQLLAYAGQSRDSASQARRLSLSRALAARSKLIEQGVRSTRIDVRALGNKSAGGPAERIDIIVTKR